MGRLSVLSRSHTPTQSTMTKWSFLMCSPGLTAAQVGGVADAHAPAFHLLEEAAAFHRAHEDDDFHRLDVGAGGDHVHGDGHARVVAGAEVFDELLGAVSPPVRAVGDLLRELVAAAKLFAQDFHDLFGVVVVFGKDEGFGQLRCGRGTCRPASGRAGCAPRCGSGRAFARRGPALRAGIQSRRPAARRSCGGWLCLAFPARSLCPPWRPASLTSVLMR